MTENKDMALANKSSDIEYFLADVPLNSTLRSRSKRLLAIVKENPDLLTQVKPDVKHTELSKRAKPGVKIHSPKRHLKRPVDFEAMDLKIDLERAVENNDVALMIQSYYPLKFLLSL